MRNLLFGFNMVEGMFSIVPFLVISGFALVFVLIIVQVIRSGKTWHKNNNSPLLKVDATIATKRADVHTHHHSTGTNDMHNYSSSTTYFVTFEVESGDRMEFKVPHSEYGLLREDDRGLLSFQGSRYISFDRK